MSKYIDYDAIDYRNDKMHDKSEEFLNGVVYMAERIEEAPSIDIVRCKECKHWSKYRTDGNQSYCEILCGYCDGDKFCAWGERKDDDD